MRAALIYNPHGGQVVTRRAIQEVISYLKGCGWAVDCLETQRPGEAAVLARNAVRTGVEVVIAAGGDGTVNEVANGIIGSDAALGVLPLGTTNVWALQMGIPAPDPLLSTARLDKFVLDVEKMMETSFPLRKTLLEAARVLVEGKTVRVDAGRIGERYFLMWAGIGLDAAIARSVPPKAKKALGSWAYFLPAMDIIREYTCTPVQLRIDDQLIEVDSTLIIVSNIQLYGGVAAIGAKARVNDGKLDISVFKGDGFFTFAEHAVRAVSRPRLHDPKMDYYQGSTITIESTRVLPVQVDGDFIGETPVRICTVPSALKVIVPENVKGGLFDYL